MDSGFGDSAGGRVHLLRLRALRVNSARRRTRAAWGLVLRSLPPHPAVGAQAVWAAARARASRRQSPASPADVLCWGRGGAGKAGGVVLGGGRDAGWEEAAMRDAGRAMAQTSPADPGPADGGDGG